jgi:hypothetical protein
MERANGAKQIREHVILDAKKFRRTANGAFPFYSLSLLSSCSSISCRKHQEAM